MAFKTIKMLGAVIFVACYIMMFKTEGANSGLLVRFFVEYIALMSAETYIGTRTQIYENEASMKQMSDEKENSEK